MMCTHVTLHPDGDKEQAKLLGTMLKQLAPKMRGNVLTRTVQYIGIWAMDDPFFSIWVIYGQTFLKLNQLDCSARPSTTRQFMRESFESMLLGT